MAEAEVDEFGVRKIYPSNNDPKHAKPWLLGKRDWDSRKYAWDSDYTTSSDNGSLVLNFRRYGGSHPGRGRNPVLSFFDSEDHTVVTGEDQRELRSRGYMGRLYSDWKNVEITLYAKINNADYQQGYRQLAIAARGGPVHSDNPIWGDPCEGTAYYVSLYVEGYTSLDKELFHKKGGYADSDFTITGDLVPRLHDPNNPEASRWIGMKGIFYNRGNGNPKIELWLDKNANNDWGSEPVNSNEDSGNWSLRDDIANMCNGDRDQKITWGGPAVIFRWDALLDVDIKFASVREIVPPEDWSIRNLLEAAGISFPFSIRKVSGSGFDLPAPISMRQLVERLI